MKNRSHTGLKSFPDTVVIFGLCSRMLNWNKPAGISLCLSAGTCLLIGLGAVMTYGLSSYLRSTMQINNQKWSQIWLPQNAYWLFDTNFPLCSSESLSHIMTILWFKDVEIAFDIHSNFTLQTKSVAALKTYLGNLITPIPEIMYLSFLLCLICPCIFLVAFSWKF